MSERMDEFDRELRAQLLIEPGPGFAAGVRRRLQTARPAPRWPWPPPPSLWWRWGSWGSGLLYGFYGRTRPRPRRPCLLRR
jgi:hypothetical protein